MTEKFQTLGDALFKQIGAIAVYWSALEAQMELAILGIQKLDINRAMPVTTNLGFRSRHDILMTIANCGGLNDKAQEAQLKKILTRTQKAYPKRNGVIHTLWAPTENPEVGRCMGVRTKGKIKVVDKKMTCEQLADIAEEIRLIGSDLTDFLDRNSLRPEYSDKNTS